MKFTVGSQEYELRMRGLACRNYERATGKNLLAENASIEIFGIADKKAEPNVNLLIEWIFACIQDGLYPKQAEIKSDDVAVTFDPSKFDLLLELLKFFNKERYGLTDEQIEKSLAEAKEKNLTASQEEAKP